VDIKNSDELAMLKQLIVDRADVFVHNLRPGSSAQYGLDATALRICKPDLIYCEIGAFGHAGPMNTFGGYDPLMQAFAGIMSLTGEEGQPPVRAGVSIVDFGSGMWAVIGILAALVRRTSSGAGATVQGSLLETALAWMSVGIANFNADGDEGGRFGSGVAFIVPHRAYEVSDGYLIVSCANDALFSRLCTALGEPSWATDERFATNGNRLKNRTEIDRLIGERLISHSRDHWQELLRANGLPVAPIQTIGEVVEHEQTEALKLIRATPDDALATVGLPLSFDGVRPAVRYGAHDIGAHNDELTAVIGTPKINNKPRGNEE
jgi:formyl-CoA transferase